MLKKETVRCRCGKEWCAVSLRAGGNIFRCLLCWMLARAAA